MNKVVISGKIISKTKQQVSKSNTTYTNLTIAVKKSNKVDNLGSLQIKCIAFDKISDIVDKYTFINDIVIISGHLDINLSNELITVIESVSLLPNSRCDNKLKYDGDDDADDYYSKDIDLVKDIVESENFI